MQFLNELRKSKGLTRSKLAIKFGVLDRTVADWKMVRQICI